MLAEHLEGVFLWVNFFANSSGAEQSITRGSCHVDRCSRLGSPGFLCALLVQFFRISFGFMRKRKQKGRKKEAEHQHDDDCIADRHLDKTPVDIQGFVVHEMRNESHS